MPKREQYNINLDDLINDYLNDLNGCLPDPIQYQYYKNLFNNTIIFNERVTQDIVEKAIIPLMEFDADPEVDNINIILNTIGGSLYDGFAMVSALENLHTPTTLRIIGMASSMGSLIAMAKNPNLTVVCDKFTVGLIHSGEQCMQGSTHAVRDTFKFSEKYENKIKEYILSHTNIDEEMYDEIERQEFWMDAEDMLKYGIVDKII
jgi:ATP-dependent Clp protease protease subunit